ncbi:MAG TPA: histidine phosphatase family protein [Sphingobacteriaceae bacterium]
MSKKLLIVRHAKSDWNDPELRDFDRPLNERGERNAPEMARRLIRQDLVPQVLVSSPALRALTTAELFAGVFGYDTASIIRIPEIYEGRSSTLLDIVNGLDNDADFAALFGHNPGVSHLASKLSDSRFMDLPTCGMVLIKFPFDDWSLISGGTGTIKWEDYPKKDHR